MRDEELRTRLEAKEAINFYLARTAVRENLRPGEAALEEHFIYVLGEELMSPAILARLEAEGVIEVYDVPEGERVFVPRYRRSDGDAEGEQSLENEDVVPEWMRNLYQNAPKDRNLPPWEEWRWG